MFRERPAQPERPVPWVRREYRDCREVQVKQARPALRVFRAYRVLSVRQE